MVLLTLISDQDSELQILENPTEESGIDCISKLPDVLIMQILSLLPLDDAYKTSILAKRWQYLWTYIDNVVFKSSNVNDFIYFTDNVVSHLNCPTIKKFSLSFGFYNGDVVSCNSKVDKWVEIAINKKVEDLELSVRNVNRYYCLPQVLCSSSSIVKLNVRGCRIIVDRVLNWASLKDLTMECMHIQDEHVQQIISNSTQLESLKLRYFGGFHDLDISSTPKLRRLELIDHRYAYRGYLESCSCHGNCDLEIVAPYVQHLKISGSFVGVKVWLNEMPSLVHADISFNINKVIEKTIVIDHLKSVQCADELVISSWYIEVISMLMVEKEDVSFPLLECTHLTITSWISKYSFLGIGRLLRSAPHLKNLIILPQRDRNFKVDWDEYIDLLRDNYPSLQENIFTGSLQSLKNAMVISMSCPKCYEDEATELLEPLKSMLEHAINLEKLVIAPGHSCNICSTAVSKIVENLLAFPRASNSAVVLSGSVPMGTEKLRFGPA